MTKAGLAYPVKDALKGHGKLPGFGRTPKAEKEKEWAIHELVQKSLVVELR